MIPFIGGSYELRARKADVQRSINLFPVMVESGDGSVPAYLKSIPGLVDFADLTDEIRGSTLAAGRLFTVAGDTLYEVASDGTGTSRGTLTSSTGAVDIRHNLDQVIITDGEGGYVFALDTDSFTQITDPAFYGSVRFAILDGYTIFSEPDTRKFYWTAIDDALTFDALDFASAEGSTDNIVAPFVDHGQLFLFKQYNIEIWDNAGGADSPFVRNNGARIETGCAAAFSIAKLDNTVYWLGQDERGSGMVWKMNGYTPVRISNHAIEEQLQGIDFSEARAYAYQQDGHSFYCLNVPGLETTLCYDVETGKWHDRAEFVDNEFMPHRGTCHVSAFGKNLIGADDGKIYEYDPNIYTNAGDVLVRDRISPHQVIPSRDKQFFSLFQLDCTVGEGSGLPPQVMMRYSNDGGAAFSNWRLAGLGATGQRRNRVRFFRCGSAYDRVYHVRFTDNAPFAIYGAT